MLLYKRAYVDKELFFVGCNWAVWGKQTTGDR